MLKTRSMESEFYSLFFPLLIRSSEFLQLKRLFKSPTSLISKTEEFTMMTFLPIESQKFTVSRPEAATKETIIFNYLFLVIFLYVAEKVLQTFPIESELSLILLHPSSRKHNTLNIPQIMGHSSCFLVVSFTHVTLPLLLSI